ncbi:MAG: hypothetical protein KGQ66_19860 [Acidobacteriota bacterium]|nr:hypothetical protein [Acidobacteriota bacterium]
MAYDDCSRYRSEAVDLVLGDLPGDRRAALVAHIEVCRGCRREVAALNATLDALSAATVPVEPGYGFVERVLDAAERDPALAALTSSGAGWVPEVAGAGWAPGTGPSAVPVGAGAGRRPHRGARRPVAAVMRRRQTLLSLTAVTILLAVLASGSGSWWFAGPAIAGAVLDVAYLGLVMAVTHLKAREELAGGLAADDGWWRQLLPAAGRAAPPEPAAGAVPTPALTASVPASVDDLALARFVLSYFTGWLLMPVVALIAVVRGDLTGVEQSPVLGRIVALQRQGRSQSLRLLAAGATTVAVASGGTLAVVVAPGMASAATSVPAAQAPAATSVPGAQSPAATSVPAAQAPAASPYVPGSTSSTGSTNLAVTYLAQLNAVTETAAPGSPPPATSPPDASPDIPQPGADGQ